MKTIKLGVLISTLLHLLYFVGTFTIGLIRTARYEPDIVSQANNVEMLQNEVVIGTTGAPLYFMLTFFGLTAIIVLGLITVQNIRRVR
ncbi:MULTISPECIES: hypothetical protein [unclassified Exiguobacterium]|uniref:hypothetical protein n=1 Tax=unclassified Exiguobacterium TaxID=2644629 RepID=UPI00103D3AD8|nr:MULTISPECIES: hypothetical protein [unclassified Exiguobacterium]TCI33523.1 hypothetical protein EVJ29_14085 [Exiguobacterium sp. SH4S7]TCI60448.1 hypothetical protein EVJ21_10740 [Exiguobacterium sp. SH0S2]